MKSNKPDSLGHFEQLVLAAISMLKGRAFGLAIYDKVEELAGKRINIGAIYTTLDRLEDKGYISTWMDEPTPERGGRRKRFCRLEAPGVEVLQESIATSERVMEGIKESWRLGKWRPSRATRNDRRE